MANTSTNDFLLYSTSNYTSITYPTSQKFEQLLVRVRDDMHNSTGGNSFIGNFHFSLLLFQGVTGISLQVRIEQHSVRHKIRNRMHLSDDAYSSSYWSMSSWSARSPLLPPLSGFQGVFQHKWDIAWPFHYTSCFMLKNPLTGVECQRR